MFSQPLRHDELSKPTPNRFGRLATTILTKALESTVKESVEHFGAQMLGQILSGAIVGPTAAVLATTAKALVTALSEQTSVMDRKLDVLLAEPLDTATAIVKDVLEMRPTNIGERDEANEDLRDALRDLRMAYSYATRLDPEQCLVIRLYQCVVLALMRNRQNYLAKYFRDLSALAIERDREAAETEKVAATIELPYSDLAFEYAEERINEDGAAGGLMAMASANDAARLRKATLEADAHQLRQEAAQLRQFQKFVTALASSFGHS